MKKRTELLVRAYFVVVVFSIIASVIAYRVVKVGILEGDKWRQKGEVNLQWKEEVADRGSIYSDDGSLLAASIQFFEIRMDLTVPKQKIFNENVDSLAYYLSKLDKTRKSKSQWLTDLKRERAKGNKYYFIAKDLGVDTYKEMKKFPIFNRGQYGGGFIHIRYGRRVKPFKEMASRTIGMDRENAQKVGLEGYFDRFLAGPSDSRLMRRISSTKDLWVPVFDPTEFQIKSGNDIVTNLNMHFQDVVHSELKESLLKYSAKKGVAILMETETGKIKAISNLDNKDGRVQEVRNTAVGSCTEPGSTFKLISVLAMLEDGHVDMDSKVDVNHGTMKFYDKTMKDSEWHKESIMTLKKAFAVSSNVGIAKFAHDAYNDNQEGRLRFRNRLKSMGVDATTGIEIVGECEPVVKHPIKDKAEWYGTTVPWMAHGYELTMSPLQMLTFYNAVANGGKMMRPYLVSEIYGEKGVEKEFHPQVLKEKIASRENIEKAQKLLEEVVLNGTAKKIASKEISLAGKTGTTRVNYANREENAKYNASFCGYFPASNPKYSLIVVMYEPNGSYYGSAVAAPVFKSIAEKVMAWQVEYPESIAGDYEEDDGLVAMPKSKSGHHGDFKYLFEYTGIPYKQKTKNAWVMVDPFETKMLIENRKIKKNEVPDVRGMGARDAIYVLENMGFGVNIKGSGMVTRQSIIPGTAAKGQKIEIQLN